MYSGKEKRIAALAVKTGMVLCLGASIATVRAGAINVPDGDFTVAAGAGQVGGGLIAASGSATIGGSNGIWTGNYNAALGLLAPPTLTITTTGGEPSGGRATISGLLAGTNLLGPLVDTGGSFTQTLTGVNYAPNMIYTLTANVDPNTLLGLGLSTLINSGVGIGLTSSATGAVANTSTSQFVNLTLLGGSDYQLRLQFTTAQNAPLGNIGITLYDLPNGLAQASVLNNVSFSNVTLDASTAAPEPSSSVLLLLGGGFCAVAAAGKKNRMRKSKTAEPAV